MSAFIGGHHLRQYAIENDLDYGEVVAGSKAAVAELRCRIEQYKNMRKPFVGQRVIVAHEFEVENNPDPASLDTMHLHYPTATISCGVRGVVSDILQLKNRSLIEVELDSTQLHSASRKRLFRLTHFARTFVAEE